MLTFLRGPLPTLWRRIGVSVLVVCGAVALLFILQSSGVQRSVALLTEWLFPPGSEKSWTIPFAQSIFPELPNGEHRVSQVLFTYIRLYAAQTFCLTFATLFFFLYSLESARKGPVTVLFSCWAAYTLGAFAYAATAEAGLRAGEGRPLALMTIHEVLLPPESLSHTLLAAPTVGCVLALCFAGVHRLRRARSACR
ncbi:hypothetical protein ACPCAE_16715 [Streptomyces cinereoruber]|uniref:hypothetical protein n=1 Tax=Streptomyces cinereoruber TaxID=67260 RepID=UPI003C2BAE53